MRIAAKILIIAGAVFLLSKYQLLPGISVSSFGTAVLIAFVLGIMNVLVRPILFILSLPLTILSLGIFVFFINAFVFWVVSLIVPGFILSGFSSIFIGALIVSVVEWFSERILP